MTTVNLGVFNEIANNKADRDLRNVDLTKTDIVIEYQEPTAENDYTWYRLYASGWVEQGGICKWDSGTSGTIALPIKMNDTNYTAIAGNGNNAANNVFTISRPEVTINTIKWYKSATDMDGYWIVLGKADMTGHEVLPSKKEIDENDHRVIAFQKPTAENNYTWYRKYADGWVEQGGTQTTEDTTINLPIEMADTNYIVNCGFVIANVGRQAVTKYTTYFQTSSHVQTSGTSGGWEVKGMAA